MGNRKWLFNGSDTIKYNFHANIKNRLSSVNKILARSDYFYNQNGAVKQINNYNPFDTCSEQFDYSPGGMLLRYQKTNQMAIGWDWRYRISPLGGREQKRMYDSPDGDTLGRTHAWTYYVLGAGGSINARWHGRQTSDSASPSDTGRRVYMYPHSYLTNGGMLTAYPDTTKEYHITDALGNVRSMVKLKSGTVTVESYDYKPFGDSLHFTGDLPNESYGNLERDIESSYITMGARQYDPALGRFLSPDPLLEAFPGQTPYNYAYNSPMLWSDPSGLAPEKEQKRDRIMVFDFKNLDLAEQYLQAALEEIEAGRALEHSLEAHRRQSERDKRWSSGGSGSGGNRTGEGQGEGNGGNTVENGQGENRNRNTGLQACDKNAQDLIKGSVEDIYENLICFDEDGYIIFLGESADIEEIVANNPESQFAKLYALANNNKETVYAHAINDNEKMLEFCRIDSPSSKLCRESSINTFKSMEMELDYTGRTSIYGIFLGKSRGLAKDLKEYISSDNISRIIFNMSRLKGKPDRYGWSGHEISFHAWRHLMGLTVRHNPNLNVQGTPEFKNSLKRK